MTNKTDRTEKQSYLKDAIYNTERQQPRRMQVSTSTRDVNFLKGGLKKADYEPKATEKQREDRTLTPTRGRNINKQKAANMFNNSNILDNTPQPT